MTQHLSDGSTEGEVGVHLDVPLKPILRRELRQANWERDHLWVRFGYRLTGGTRTSSRRGSMRTALAWY